MAAARATKQDDAGAAPAYSSNGNGNGHAAANTFYSAATGVYSSTHPPVALPADPSLSLVPHLFATAGLPVPGSTMSIATRPEPPCLVDAATSHAVTRADLCRLVSLLAAGLRRRHLLRKGDVVLLLLPNSVAFPVAFLAVLAAGAVATTMNPSSAAAEIAARVRDTCPALVLAAAGDESVAKLPPALRVPVVLVPESFHLGNDDAPELKPFHELLAGSGGGEAAALAAVGQDDAAAIIYSSGTGGRSKGAVLTHRNLIATVELFVRFETSRSPHAGGGGGDVYLAALPMFHVYGLALFVVGLLALPPGSTVVVMRRFDAGEAVKAIRRYGVTHFPLVPPIMAALVAAAAAAGKAAGSPAASLGLESLVQVLCGAAPASRKLINEFVEAFPHVDFVQGYAMTESAAVATRGFNTPKQKKYNSIGFLAPNMNARIIDVETGCPMPPGSCGELWLHGPAIMQGYLNNEGASTIIIDGWLRTGDICYFDEDGSLYIVGRLKDTIKYKGFQIAPADLEEVLIGHPEIVDTAVTSAKDEEAGEIPVAFVVRKSGTTLSCAQVMEYVAKQVSSYKKVRKVIFVESIPKSPTGKVLRRLLKENLINVGQNIISKM